MKIEELEEKFQQVRQLRWLEDIAEVYREHLALIDHNADTFTIRGIAYTCRGDGRSLDSNPHRPIPAKYLRDGLAEVLGNLEHEIETLKTEIER